MTDMVEETLGQLSAALDVLKKQMEALTTPPEDPPSAAYPTPPETDFTLLEGPPGQIIQAVRERQRWGWRVVGHSAHHGLNIKNDGTSVTAHVVAMVQKGEEFETFGEMPSGAAQP